MKDFMDTHYFSGPFFNHNSFSNMVTLPALIMKIAFPSKHLITHAKIKQKHLYDFHLSLPHHLSVRKICKHLKLPILLLPLTSASLYVIKSVLSWLARQNFMAKHQNPNLPKAWRKLSFFPQMFSTEPNFISSSVPQ